MSIKQQLIQAKAEAQKKYLRSQQDRIRYIKRRLDEGRLAVGNPYGRFMPYLSPVSYKHKNRTGTLTSPYWNLWDTGRFRDSIKLSKTGIIQADFHSGLRDLLKTIKITNEQQRRRWVLGTKLK